MTEYLDVANYLTIAAAVTGLDVETITKVTNLNSAGSMSHAPDASFGGTDFYAVMAAAWFPLRANPVSNSFANCSLMTVGWIGGESETGSSDLSGDRWV